MSLARYAVLVVLVVACNNSSQPPEDPKINQVENSLTPGVVYGDTIPNLNLGQRMREKGVKGLSIAVINNYEIVWAKGYGWADSAEGRKVTPDTRFQAASISKSLNSLAIMKLIQEGKLDGDADINNYLKSWQFPYDPVSKGKKINAWQLMSHTAGLNVHGFPGYKETDSLPTIVQVLDGLKPANTGAVRSVNEPGKEFKYSGGGTTILQLMLQDITGKSYADYIQENILNPIGMTNSSFQQPPSSKGDYATGYYQDGNAVEGKFHIYPEQAAAGLWTTPTDLAKYIIECQKTLKAGSGKILSREMMEKRMTPYMDSIFAMGVFIVSTPGGNYFTHNGGNEAFLCTSYGSLENGNGVVIMINGENFSIISEVLNAVARVYGWKDFLRNEFRPSIPLQADSLAQYTGKFLLNKDTIQINQKDGKLFGQQNRQPAAGYRLHFSNVNAFSLEEVPGARFIWLRDRNGFPGSLLLSEDGREVMLRRIE